jgi:hypothetical protein
VLLSNEEESDIEMLPSASAQAIDGKMTHAQALFVAGRLI